MGDRGTVVMQKQGGSDICFYSHWGASELPQTVASALERGRGRWDDEPYLNRIVFSEMIQDNVMSETGFGISTSISFDSWRNVYVNHDTKSVRVDDLDMEWDFERFIIAFLRVRA